MSDVELNAAERGFSDRGDVPLIAPLSVLARWWEHRHMELMAAAGFDDLRVAHNAIAANLPAEGMRLTQLAQTAGMSKQAMAELVVDAEALGYIRRVADPTDGRAKIIIWDRRGEAAHQVTLKAFAQIEQELAEVVGADDLAAVRDVLLRAMAAVAGGPASA